MKIQAISFVKPVLTSAIMLLTANAALAADKELLDILLGNGAITQQQYTELLAKEELEQADVAKISFGNGSGLNVSSGDGKYEVEIGGRLQLDYVDHSFNSLIGTAPISGTQVRRSRIEIDGTFDERWGYAAEFDFAKNGVAIKDLKFGYTTEGGTSIFVGHQKQPYSLSMEMSSNDLPFVERGADMFLVSTFADRAIGIRTENSGDKWFFSSGLFGDTLKTGGPGDEGWGASARYVYSPIVEDDKVIHLGIRGSYREFDDSSPTVSIKDKTTDFSGFSIVNTGSLGDATSASLFGPEIAASFGPLFMFAEYTSAEIERSAQPTLDFNSWQAGFAWTLTGESRAARYRMSAGEFKNIRPTRHFDPVNGGIGAWEVAARLSSIDLNDGNITGGEEDALSLSLNWYPNRNIRILADWTRIIDTDESNNIRQFAPDMDIFTIRTQWNY